LLICFCDSQGSNMCFWAHLSDHCTLSVRNKGAFPFGSGVAYGFLALIHTLTASKQLLQWGHPSVLRNQPGATALSGLCSPGSSTLTARYRRHNVQSDQVLKTNWKLHCIGLGFTRGCV
jgi:hypothetical protein